MHRPIVVQHPRQVAFRRARAELMFLGTALRALSRPLIGLTSIFFIGAVIFRYLGAPPGGEEPTWSDAIFNSFCLLMLEHVDPLPENRLAQAVQYVQPVVGAFWLAEGVIKLGLTLFDKQHNPETWIGIMAKASKGHIILCGLGTVGFRVLGELAELGQQVFVVE
jgi:voltage-gated potassium channel